jgi:hypothetical protein
VFMRRADGTEVRWDLILFNSGLHNLNNSTQGLAAYDSQLKMIVAGVPPLPPVQRPPPDYHHHHHHHYHRQRRHHHHHHVHTADPAHRARSLHCRPPARPITPSRRTGMRRLQPQAKLVWATTTPYMPDKTTGNFAVEQQNAIAATIMTANAIPSVDLYARVVARCGSLYTHCDICDDESRYHPGIYCGYHYTAEGFAYISQAVSAAIRAHL